MEIKCTEKELFIFKKIAHAAEELGVSTYVIGGFVRDKILKRATTDVDIVCVGDAISLARKTAHRFNPVPHVSYFKTYGTAHIRIKYFDEKESDKVLHNDHSLTGADHDVTQDVNSEHPSAYSFDIEFVGARKESYSYHSRNPEVKPGTIEDDQNRRDFTINAMAISLNLSDYGKLIDPFDGISDLKREILKTPKDPIQTFSDDPLRMLRAIRFAAQLHFKIEEKTFQAIKDNAYRINIVSQERITEELNKILACDQPSIGFDLMYQTGLLHIIFPQMVDLAGAEYKDGIGHKDNFYHTLEVLDNVAQRSTDLWLRWSAVLHDIAKPVTKKFEPDHGWTFHGHEVVGGKLVPKLFAKFRLPQNEKMRFVRKMVELHLRPISLTKEDITDSAIRRLLFDAGEDLESLMILCESDITSKNKNRKKRYVDNFNLVRQRCQEVEESDRIRTWQPPITGEMIMETFGIPPSEPIGSIKKAIKEAILDGVIPNTYEAAYEYMIEKGKDWELKPVKK